MLRFDIGGIYSSVILGYIYMHGVGSWRRWENVDTYPVSLVWWCDHHHRGEKHNRKPAFCTPLLECSDLRWHCERASCENYTEYITYSSTTYVLYSPTPIGRLTSVYNLINIDGTHHHCQLLTSTHARIILAQKLSILRHRCTITKLGFHCMVVPNGEYQLCHMRYHHGRTAARFHCTGKKHCDELPLL
jgi:hypothetical protein